jgi:hypothetical protein
MMATVRRARGAESARRAMALWLFAPATFNERRYRSTRCCTRRGPPCSMRSV